MKKTIAAALKLNFVYLFLTCPVQAQTDLEPLIAEELIELALAQCSAGNALQASRLAQEIRYSFTTTAAIDVLLDPMIEGACEPRPKALNLELNITTGWDDNINQGITSSSITFSGAAQTASQPLTLILDDSYRPISGTFINTTASIQQTTRSGWTMQAIAGARQVNNASAYNVVSLQGAARHPLRVWGMPGQLILGLNQDWLAGARYHNALSMAWQSQPSRGKQGWVLSGNAQQHNYTASTADNLLIQADISHQHQVSARHLFILGAGILHDQALGPRAGGNRMGSDVHAQWQYKNMSQVWYAQWAAQHWTSSEAFFKGLIDQQRYNTTSTWVLGYQQTILGRGCLFIEYQHRSSKDNVPLYANQSNKVSVGWQLDWM